MKFSHKKYCFILVFGLLSLSSSLAETLQIDSLKLALTSVEEVSTKAKIYNELSFEYKLVSLDSSFKYAEKAVYLTKDLKEEVFLEQQAIAFHNLGIVYWFKADFPKALDMHQKSLEAYQNINDIRGVISSSNEIGKIYYSLKNYEKAIAHFKITLNRYALIENQNNQPNIANTYGNIGTCYREVAQLDSALFYVLKAVEISRSLPVKRPLVNNLTEASLIYTNKGEFDKAKNLLNEASTFIEDIDKHFFYALYFRASSFLADSLGQTDQVIKHGELMYKHASSANMNVVKAESAKLLASAYAKKGLYEKAFDYQKEMSLVREVLYHEDRNKQFFLMEIDRKDDALKIEQQKNKLQQAIISKNNLLILSISSVLFLTIIVGFLIFRGKQKEAKKNRLLSKQKQEISVQNEKLNALNKELDNFAYNVAHDLKAPLSSIKGLVEIATLVDDRQEQLEVLKKMDESVEKSRSFIEDLEAIARNKRTEIEIQSINFDELLNDCLNHVRFMENADKVSITYNVANKKEFHSDSHRISIIINNLLSNSIRYQSPNFCNNISKIFVEIIEKIAVVKVIDNGIGIPPDFINKVFDMFETGGSKQKGSTGLGLYIVKETVEKLGGNIFVESEVSKGTTFTVKLPSLK